MSEMEKKSLYKVENQLTVSELIKKLKNMPQDMFVCIEGCDCEGFAINVSIQPNYDCDNDDKYVLIER